MKLAENFYLSEFNCKDGTEVPCKYLQNVKILAENLQVLRGYFGKPIYINSSYRTPRHNKKIGGATHSQHLTASAADIRIDGVTSINIKDAIVTLISQGKMTEGGIGLYNSFLHFDIRGTKARWDFRS